MHLKETKALEPIHATMQVLSADDKRLHVFQRIVHTPTGDMLATGEQMLLHVDVNTKRAGPAEPKILEKVREIAAAHAALPRPDGAGRFVGQKKS